MQCPVIISVHLVHQGTIEVKKVFSAVPNLPILLVLSLKYPNNSLALELIYDIM